MSWWRRYGRLRCVLRAKGRRKIALRCITCLMTCHQTQWCWWCGRSRTSCSWPISPKTRTTFAVVARTKWPRRRRGQAVCRTRWTRSFDRDRSATGRRSTNGSTNSFSTRSFRLYSRRIRPKCSVRVHNAPCTTLRNCLIDQTDGRSRRMNARRWMTR